MACCYSVQGLLSCSSVKSIRNPNIEAVLKSRNWSEPGSLDEAVALVDWGRREALRLAGS